MAAPVVGGWLGQGPLFRGWAPALPPLPARGRIPRCGSAWAWPLYGARAAQSSSLPQVPQSLPLPQPNTKGGQAGLLLWNPSPWHPPPGPSPMGHCGAREWWSLGPWSQQVPDPRPGSNWGPQSPNSHFRTTLPDNSAKSAAWTTRRQLSTSLARFGQNPVQSSTSKPPRGGSETWNQPK